MNFLDSGLGIWQIMNSNIITDLIAKSGFDFTILDLEHGLHNPKTVQDCVFAAKSNSLLTVARIPNSSYQDIVQLIDTGIDAILFPHIETTSQLNEIIQNSLLPPFGKKSFSPFVSKYNYGGLNKEFKENLSIGILIESVKGIDNAENLLQSPSIDFVYFGAYDLSVEIGKPGEIFNNEIINYLKILIGHAKQNKKKILAIYRNPKELDILLELGIELPVASVDTSHLMNKLKAETSNYKKTIN